MWSRTTRYFNSELLLIRMNGQRVFHGCLIILSIVHFSSCQIAGTTSSTEDSPAYASTIVATTTVLVPDTTEATSTTLHFSTAAPVSTTDPSLTSTGSPPSVSTTTPISFEPTSKPTTSPVPDAVPESVLVDSDGLCPKDFVYFTKSATCYKVYSLPVTWVEADRICRKDKAVLVSAPLVQVPHFANLTTYWLNWRLRPTVQYPTEIKRNESEVRSRMWYRESIYPAKGNFITANEGLHAVHRASELQFARSMLGTALQPDQNVSEHGELGDSCLFATRSHPSSFEPYCPEILSTSHCMNPPNTSFSTTASFVCEFNVEEYAVFTAAQLGRARLMTSWSYSTHSEGLQLVSDGYKKKYKDCYTAFPFPNDTAYFHPAGGLGMSHWVVEGPERTTCYMTKYLDLESSKGWSFEGAKESCQQYSSFLQPSTAFPTLYQSRSVGQFVYSRFFDDVVAGVVGTELGRWVGAVWVNGSEANGGNGTWYWDGPDGHGVQVPLRFLLSIIGDDGKCLEERQQLPLELFTPEKISTLLSGEGNSFLGWYRRSCSNQSSLGTLQRSSVVCQKDLTRLTTTPPGDSVNLAVTIRKGYDSYSQWANHPDEIPLLTCDIPENETLFDSPVVFLSSWFTYNSSVWRPYLTYHLNLDQVIGNSSGNQFRMDFQNGFRPEAPQNPEKNFCLAYGVPIGPGQLVPPCVPSTETQYFGDIGLPSDYMLLRFAGYYQCGAVSSSTNQWVWSDPIYVEDSFLRYPFQIYSSLDITAASLQVAGTPNFHPFDNLWNFVLNAVENFTVDFHTSNRSHELQQYLRNGSSSIVLTVLQLEETNKLTDKEVTLSGLLAVRKINMSMSGPQPNKRDAERQEPSYSSISPTEMARATQDLTSSEKFLVDRLMYSLDRHLVKSAKENNLSGSSVIMKSTSGCWNERHYFVQSNLTFRWLEFKPDVVNRSFDYPVEYCPGTPYRRDCTGNREHGFTSKFVEGKCTGPIVPPSPLTTSLLNLQANSPPGPEQLSTLNKTVSNETNFSIVDLRLIGQILQSNTDPKLSSIPQSSFDNIYDVINRILQLDRPNNVGTAQSVYGSSNQFLSSMGSAAALVDTADHRPVERKMLSVSVFSVSSHNDTIGFTADSTGLTKTENRTHAHPDTVNVSMAFPTSLAEHLLNKSGIRTTCHLTYNHAFGF
ncbi:hypothetical protein RvY_10822 [Ramazzottius varieornatus]|uniref:C-type lectin domain-containing protein n=1 Tax=Ramazzottius varieornatus TaxID=947166 RepID=A0A1D1VGH5_RAMVA|nr:hypothetical protein RvY_10822 [Ramazzottius varieornatus]